MASPSPLSHTLDGVRRLADGGVGAIVLFSLFEEQLREEAAHNAVLVDGPAESFSEALDYVPAIMQEDAGPADARLPRAWIALLRRSVRASLAATTGVEVPADVAAYLLAGADVVMTTSALLRHGPGYATELLNGLATWMSRKRFHSVDEVRGLLSAPSVRDPEQHARSGYVAAMRAANAGAYAPW